MSVVFTNGVFDCLHVGHFNVLEAAFEIAQEANVPLVVAIDSDERVLALKNKPTLFSENERVAMLRSLNIVDEVYIFNSDEELYGLVHELEPIALVKGPDYNPDEVIGGDLCYPTIAKRKVCISTSEIVNRVKMKYC